MCKIEALLLIFCLASCSSEPGLDNSPLSITETLASQQTDGYLKAMEPRPFQFPKDHGAHPGYKNEWWYFTGNLQTEEGREFGYQFTLFRNAITAEAPDASSDWATNQVYMAHVALSDVANQRFYHDEQFSRDVLQIAGARSGPVQLWLGDWSVVGLDVDEKGIFPVELKVNSENFTLMLGLESMQAMVLHGEEGLSAKSPSPGNSSYYYSYPRIKTDGTISIGDETVNIVGESWFDHEWSTTSLEKDQTGWDWFSLQLSDGAELMLFKLRYKNNSTGDYYYGSYIDVGGDMEKLDGNDFTIKNTSSWQSPLSGAVYPAAWKIDLPEKKLELDIVPKMPNQEMNTSFRYWEGAVRIIGFHGDNQIDGHGYVELTGYR